VSFFLFLFWLNAKAQGFFKNYYVFKAQENHRFSANFAVINFIADKILAPYSFEL
jgi:hypothetical protein